MVIATPGLLARILVLGCITLAAIAATPSPSATAPSSSTTPAPFLEADCSLPTLSAADFAKLNLDFIVIGSGAGGLPLAVRLSENSSFNIGVIEAGIFRKNDPAVDIPGRGGKDIGNSSYDWLFSTVPQKGAGGRSIAEPRGKMLGGSTGLNQFGWDHASKEEYDAWATFVNNTSGSNLTQWDFANLLPYFQKSENVDLTNFNNANFSGTSPDKSVFQNDTGFSGPVQVGYNTVYGDLVGPYVKTWNSLNVSTNFNIFGGSSAGIRNERRSISNGQRTYTATAYYCPASQRSNFHVLTGAQVLKINFSNSSGNGLLTATNVTFVDISSNSTFTVAASKEIILSAGAVQTPQLLELSGIGNSSILNSLGIETLVDLPGVGENLQDHIFAGNQFVALQNITTFDKLRYNQTFLKEQQAQYDSDHTGFLTTTDCALVFLPANTTSIWNSTDLDSLVADLQNALQQPPAQGSPFLTQQWQMQLSWLTNNTVPQTEIILRSSGLVANQTDTTNYLSMLAGLLHPLSRGSIHINSTNPMSSPVIDPNYLSEDYDIHALRTFLQITLQIPKNAPVSAILQGSDPLIPDPATASNSTNLQQYIRTSFGTGDHLMGTAAMAAQSLGGVVDASLKVYGTSNLRVVDASIMPLQIGAHLQSTVYAISEKAADIVKAEQGEQGMSQTGGASSRSRLDSLWFPISILIPILFTLFVC